MDSLESVQHFVDDYLGYLYELRPTAASFDGVHAFDDHVEDFTRASLDRQTRDLGGFARRLASIRPDALSLDDRLDRATLEQDVHARLLELERVRSHERSPQFYADTLSTTLASQVVLAYAPSPERGRRLVSKLRQVSPFLNAARQNVKEPPGLFIKTAIETLRGLTAFIERDMPRALWDLDDLSILSDLDLASTEAVRAIDAYATELETEALPKAKGSFRLGPEVFSEKLRLDEGIDVPLDKLIDIAERELSETQDEFRRTASRIKDGDAVETWQALKADHPAAGKVVAEAREQVQALRAFVEREGFVSVPEHDPIHIGPTPPFCRWTFASIWAPGPFEARGVKAHYYLTEAESGWTPERQELHLRDLNRPTLCAISMHEVYPGHYLHFQHLRQINSKLRKSLMTMPMSVIEGWAHYAEHLAIDAGFDLYGPATKLGQLAETLVRLSRLVVAIRLHTEDWSVEQGVRFFRESAFLEEGSARKEAERGTFDPGYGVYSLGKLILLKLRKDVQAQQASRFSLKSFHDSVLALGGLRYPLQREALLGPESGTLLE